ncbi:MAG TPA: copper chaperone CopZ [Candidatus Nosocomiicoccus stercorigallinarum]|nr:copper chaperone CopZ [Candidatus Nosocomiicoccus stercorigallinarum]
MESIIKVEGMTCGHCKQSVETALNNLDGVQSATVDLENGDVTVTHEDSVTKETMSEAIEDQGFDVV